MKKSIVSILLAALSVGLAHADDTNAWGVSVKAGVAGLGLDVVKPVSESVKLRAGSAEYSQSFSRTYDQGIYDGSLKIGGWNLLADWHAWGGGWRVSGGVYGPSHSVSGTGTVTGSGVITLNGKTYSTTDLAGVDLKAKWNGVKPYLGFGYDGFNSVKNGGFFLTADVGVIFAGAPKVSLTSRCVNVGVCAAIEADRIAQEDKIRNDLNDFKFLPVAQVGIGYRF